MADDDAKPNPRKPAEPAKRGRDVRGRGRELAVAGLCHLESYPPADRASALRLLWKHPPRGDEEGEDFFADLVRDDDVRAFAEALVLGVVEHWTEIDQTISSVSKRWRIERMDRVDRNVLRLGAHEFSHAPEVPRAVIISEAVRIAARYGSERSVAFVNGLVESLASALRPEGGHE